MNRCDAIVVQKREAYAWRYPARSGLRRELDGGARVSGQTHSRRHLWIDMRAEIAAKGERNTAVNRHCQARQSGLKRGVDLLGIIEGNFDIVAPGYLIASLLEIFNTLLWYIDIKTREDPNRDESVFLLVFFYQIAMENELMRLLRTIRILFHLPLPFRRNATHVPTRNWSFSGHGFYHLFTQFDANK